jgi:hypothetical protein
MSAPQGAQQAPAPSHQQTVAALRHFGMIEKELGGLLADPDLGRTDMKSKIIDGATALVGLGIMSPPDAVTQLATVPERPFDQKGWIEKHFVDAIKAANMILDQHRAAFDGQPAPPPGTGYDPDHHQSIIAGLQGHYKGLRG